MYCVVTGAAGFVGSHLCERLVRDGHDVAGIDCFIPYYPREVKEANLAWLRRQPRFRFYELDLRTADLTDLVRDADVIFHEAAMAGLLKSWSDFDLYMTCNVQATQRLLEAMRLHSKGRLIYASTSSIYGREARGPEDTLPRPVSPYGVTKLAAEHLCQAYHENFGLDVVVLRYFSIYGPRQRPDMAYHMFIDALLHDRPILITGSLEQTRGNTYVLDVVEATLLAWQKARSGEIYNIGGGQAISLRRVLELLEEITGKRPQIEQRPPRPGDQLHTLADTRRAREQLGWVPRTPIEEGLRAQVAWQQAMNSSRQRISAID